jgi:hypothetical protein
MGCRCDSIRRCTNDISSVNAIKRTLSSEHARGVSISNYLSTLASSTGGAVQLQNTASLKTSITEMDDFQESELPRLIAICDTHLTRLNQELESMRREDYSSHNSSSSSEGN